MSSRVSGEDEQRSRSLLLVQGSSDSAPCPTSQLRAPNRRRARSFATARSTFQTTMGMSPTGSGAATAPLIITVAITAITAIIGGHLVERGSGFRTPTTAASAERANLDPIRLISDCAKGAANEFTANHENAAQNEILGRFNTSP